MPSYPRGIIVATVLLVIATIDVTFCGTLAKASESHPNIVLVMADDQGWGDMAYNGHPVLKTPNFDAAAAAGLRFDRFYAAAPVCSPTRASVLTGRHPNRMGVFQWGYPLRPREITIAERLRSAGYATGHFGKWHLGSVRRESPVHPGHHGFDRWISAPNFYENDAILSDEGRAIQTKGESSIVTVDLALQWMKKVRREDRPFFAVVWFGSPHGPHIASEADRKHYMDQPKNLREFYGEITGMDRAFGKLRAALDEMDVRENTILWYCSDNGALPRVGNTGGHRGNKGLVYDGGLLVPSILEWPAMIPSPRASDMRCNTCDILPTLLDVVGVSLGDDRPLDGISLRPLIRGEQSERQRPMGFWDYQIGGISTPSAKWMGELLQAQQSGRDLPPHESVQLALEDPEIHSLTERPGEAAWIDGPWKLHRHERRNNPLLIELYNLENDPQESNDLAAQLPDRVARMKADLESWMESVISSYNGED